MEVSGKYHSPATLSRGRTRVHIEQWVRWAVVITVYSTFTLLCNDIYQLTILFCVSYNNHNIPLHSTNQAVFKTERHCAVCEVRTEL
jgi:hypothetical protein